MSDYQKYDWDKKNSVRDGELVIFRELGMVKITNDIHSIFEGIPFSSIENLSHDNRKAVLNSLWSLGENVKPTIQRWHVGGGQSQ